MKRIGNLFSEICSIENLNAADMIARKGKSNQFGIKIHDKKREDNILTLHKQLVNREYITSKYKSFKIFDPKERMIFKLPYFPDRILHHAIMRKMESIFVDTFTRDTYSCIKGRGIHAAANAIKESLKDYIGTKYCLKIDVKKFYPSIDHEVLKTLLRRKVKDYDLLRLLDEIIDSADGVPIGNYLSQYFANFYLSYFDHWIKQTMCIKHYFRYADDMVFLSSDKEELHLLLNNIKKYLSIELNLQLKYNYQIFPVASRGIDFVGYVFFHTHTRLRKSIKQNFARMIAKNKNKKSIASYNGWIKHCDGKHLLKKVLHGKETI